MALRDCLRERGWIQEVLLVPWILAAAYAALGFSYGQTDDQYYLREIVESGQTWFGNPFIQMGRPLTGWLTLLVFTHCGSIQGLVWARLWAALGACLLAVRLRGCLVRQGIAPETATCGAAVLVITPGLLSWVGWTVCFPYPLAAWLSVVLGEWVLRGGWLRLSGAGLGLLLVLCIYQPAAGFFLLPGLVAWVRGTLGSGGRAWIQGATLLALSALSHVTYVLGFRFAQSVWGFSSARASVGGMNGERLQAVFLDVLPGLGASWVRVLSPATALPLGILIWLMLTGWAVRRLGWIRVVTLLGALGLCLGFALATTLLSQYGVFFFRVRAPAESLALAWMLALSSLLLVPRRMMVTWALAAVSVAGIGAWTLREGIAAPNEAEYHRVRDWVQAQAPWLPREILIRQPGPGGGVHPLLRPNQHEYGTVSGDVSWGLTAMAVNCLRESGRLHPLERFPYVWALAGAEAREARGGWFLPMDEINGEPPASAGRVWEHPRLGLLRQTQGDDATWWYSSWLGPVNLHYLTPEGQGSIYWLDHGWTRLGAGTGPVEWLEHPTLGWIRTSAGEYPNVWSERHQAWGYIENNGYRPFRFWLQGQPRRLPVRDF